MWETLLVEKNSESFAQARDFVAAPPLDTGSLISEPFDLVLAESSYSRPNAELLASADEKSLPILFSERRFHANQRQFAQPPWISSAST